MSNSLVGKFVKTVDGDINNTGILNFMYPNFVSRDEVFYDNDYNVLYMGRIYNGLRKDLELNTKSFICVCNSGIYDIDFTSRNRVLEVLSEKWNKTFKDEVVETLENSPEHDFWQYFKNYWVTGKSTLDDSDITLWDLYKVLGKQRHEILKVYLKLKEFYNNNFIFSGVLSFIEKSMDIDNVSSQNGRYLKMLQDFNKEYSGKIIPIVQRAYIMSGSTELDKEYRTLWVLMQIGKGNMV